MGGVDITLPSELPISAGPKPKLHYSLTVVSGTAAQGVINYPNPTRSSGRKKSLIIKYMTEELIPVFEGMAGPSCACGAAV